MSGEALEELKGWWHSTRYKAYTAFFLLVVGVGWSVYLNYQNTGAFMKAQTDANLRFEAHMTASDAAREDQKVLNEHISSRQTASEDRLKMLENFVYERRNNK